MAQYGGSGYDLASLLQWVLFLCLNDDYKCYCYFWYHKNYAWSNDMQRVIVVTIQYTILAVKCLQQCWCWRSAAQLKPNFSGLNLWSMKTTGSHRATIAMCKEAVQQLNNVCCRHENSAGKWCPLHYSSEGYAIRVSAEQSLPSSQITKLHWQIVAPAWLPQVLSADVWFSGSSSPGQTSPVGRGGSGLELSPSALQPADRADPSATGLQSKQCL